MDVPVAANVLGTLGAVCWSIQVATILLLVNLVPQVANLPVSLYPRLLSITAVTMPLGFNLP
jgi:hypothetical protein